jgi:serine protease Do
MGKNNTMTRTIFLSIFVLAMATGLAAAQKTREEKVRNDRDKVVKEGFWLYNDLAAGFSLAKKNSKPLLVVLRCIPCEACVKLDDDLVDRDPRVRPLLEKFVCVRVVSTNGLDLSLFQYDYDQSFAAFLLNADGTIYGRFGTRSHRTSWSDDVSIEGLARALRGGLELHAQYPKNREALTAKHGPKPEFPSPEKYPSLRDKYGPQLDYAGKVVASCIHCHQVGDAQRQFYRARHEPLPTKLLFPYPHPKAIGLVLDPKEKATVRQVEEDSPAAQAGFRPGDEIVSLEGQPLLSFADVQWVLHNAADEASLKAQVRRDGKTSLLTLKLPEGWRRRDVISWRVSSWGLRRIAAGGMLLEEMSKEERIKASLPERGMALRVRYVGQSGPHAAGKRAGFQQGDVLVSFDGKTDLLRETDLLAYAVNAHKPGAMVPVIVRRGDKRIELTLSMQE